jgi:hypothetical protein
MRGPPEANRHQAAYARPGSCCVGPASEHLRCRSRGI